MNYTITHLTTYCYAEKVAVSHHLTRMTPRSLPRQRCTAHRIEVNPAHSMIAERLDYFGNPVSLLTVEEPHDQLTIRAVSSVSVDPVMRVPPESTPPWETVRDLFDPQCEPSHTAAQEFVFESALTPLSAEIRAFAAASFPPGQPLLVGALDLMARIHREFIFDPTATTVSTPLAQMFAARRGVCQDFAHLQIAGLRSLGLPARYVSGYLQTRPPPGQPRLVGADASHAWLAVYCPNHDWLDLDPTNNICPGDRHITLGWGRDYSDVSPIRGVVDGGGAHELTVAVDVVPA